MSAYSDFKAYLAGKRVAVVGPASTLRGTGMGSYIDAHDVVVRLNHAWPLPGGLKRDIGSRIDVIYHNLNPSNQRIAAGHVAGMHRDGVRWLVASQPANIRLFRQRHRRFRRVNRGLLRFRIVPAWLKERLRRHVGSPNCGLVAIADLLRFPIERLYVTGFSFYTTEYLDYPNYEKIPLRMATRVHNQRRHKAYMARLVRCESRLEVDPFIARLLEEFEKQEGRG